MCYPEIVMSSEFTSFKRTLWELIYAIHDVSTGRNMYLIKILERHWQSSILASFVFLL
jgi:hypothetical protein